MKSTKEVKRKRLTQIRERRQQVCGVAHFQDGQFEGHLRGLEVHREVLHELTRQALLQHSHVAGDIVGQEHKHADLILHLDLTNLEAARADNVA